MKRGVIFTNEVAFAKQMYPTKYFCQNQQKNLRNLNDNAVSGSNFQQIQYKGVYVAEGKKC